MAFSLSRALVPLTSRLPVRWTRWIEPARRSSGGCRIFWAGLWRGSGLIRAFASALAMIPREPLPITGCICPKRSRWNSRPPDCGGRRWLSMNSWARATSGGGFCICNWSWWRVGDARACDCGVLGGLHGHGCGECGLTCAGLCSAGCLWRLWPDIRGGGCGLSRGRCRGGLRAISDPCAAGYAAGAVQSGVAFPGGRGCAAEPARGAVLGMAGAGRGGAAGRRAGGRSGPAPRSRSARRGGRQRGGLADRLLADLAPARNAADGRMIAASALIEAELRPEPDAVQVYVWYSIAAALSAAGAATARDASFAALSSEDQAGAEDTALQGFQALCADVTVPVAACDAVVD